MSPQPLEVTAALIRCENRLLIAQKAKGSRFAGKWEFPGGKIDPGETPPQALQRELQEELGIRKATIGDLFSETLYTHEAGQIRQFTYWVDVSCQEKDHVYSEEHQSLTWIRPEELRNYEFSGADCLIVEQLIQSGFMRGQAD